jgi:hypothetical protein
MKKRLTSKTVAYGDRAADITGGSGDKDFHPAFSVI